ncbi:bifunctional RNase H/acid phosphatase [Ornithinimicrobium pratense]|uniref:Bifunctional RNase H/acid phosphatase n=1 Tax=Ornithinimicrobium pratense TaxID=2593973 RepID=A0A5J6VA47_9MICO|nr:bifunctional RNase H/acid phosphatase [Ornithinimicrobium pratense]
MRHALIVEADGGSRGNPGVAGYGALVRDARTGTVLAERAAPLGTASNNVAEYSGLLAGLRAVLDLDLAREAAVEVRMDSKLVVEQMAGRWKIKHADMRRLALEARELVDAIQRQDGTVSFTWIPREQNGAADALSNDGMDGQTVRRDHVGPAGQAGESRGERGGEADAPWSLFDEPQEERPSTDGGTAYQKRQEVRPTFGEQRAPVADLVLSDETVPVLEGQTRLILVRHGITDYTQQHRVDGRGGADPALNSTGMAQARAAAQAVLRLVERSEPGPVSVVSSSLERARQTGQAIADALGVQREEDRDWDEQGFGDWDGRTMGELAEEFGQELLALRSDADYKRPGGESRRELDERVAAALTRAVQRGDTVVVATHRVALMSVLCRLLGIDHERGWSLATAPASLSAVEIWPDGVAQVAFVNDTHHLHDLVQPPGQDAPATIVDRSLD